MLNYNYFIPFQDFRKYLVLLLLLLFATGIRADGIDSAYMKKYNEYAVLYYKNDEASAKKFSAIVKELEDYHLKRNNLYGYYSICLGEIFYDSDHNRPFDAIRKANNLFSEMKNRGQESFFLVYEALGHIFQSRGNYSMAEKYYLDADKNCPESEILVKMRIYFRLANLNMINYPKVARTWSQKCDSLSHGFPDFRQTFYMVESIIDFSLNDADGFWDSHRKFTDLQKEHPELGGTGSHVMNILQHAFKGEYQDALTQLGQPSAEFNDIERLDLRRVLLERMNNYPEALRTEIRRSELVDSLNTDMLFENLNQIGAEIAVAKMETKVAEERQVWLTVALVLLLLAIGALTWRYVTRNRMRKQLMKQNEELEIALSRAQESDRMKSAFISHVSHEIRTPLNIITGFSQIISNPQFQLDEKERTRMFKDIMDNSAEMTAIVNELLDVANEESKEYCSKDDVIDIDQLCQELMKKAEKMNDGRLELKYVSLIDEGFTLRSNRKGVEKIVAQLLDNAVKFTEHGSVELQARNLPANGGVEFRVTDTGIGISEEDQDKVFDIFYKADKFKKGVGLGLYACKKTTSLLGGTLQLDKNYTQGTRFILTLPAV